MGVGEEKWSWTDAQKDANKQSVSKNTKMGNKHTKA